MNAKPCKSKRHGRLVTAILSLVLLSFVASARAESIWSNNITNSNPSAFNPFTSGDVNNANTTVSGIGRGSGINPNAGADRYNARDWSSSIGTSDYFYWTLTPNSGYEIDFDTLTGAWQRSSTGPNSYRLRSSVDNYVSDIASGAITGSSSAVAFSLNLDTPSFESIDSAVTFRLYAYGGTNTAGTFSINNFDFNGAVNAVPEPSTMVLLCTAGFLGLALRRRMVRV